ncbi:MAG: acyl-CoA synthetase [Pirellulaceae bacterium]|nr:acyl-CoA synthetase [Pirellulaceae bacterium]
MKSIQLLARARVHGDRIAFQSDHDKHSYAELIDRAEQLAHQLLDGRDDLQEARIGFLIPAGVDYVVAQWGVWLAGGIAVPLSLSATVPELSYTLKDSQTCCLIANQDQLKQLTSVIEAFDLRTLTPDVPSENNTDTLPPITPDRRAMILYTSGTTSTPKGVVTTHANIESQITTLVEAWQWESTDRIPLFLPLHHIHGIINVMSCALWSGATIEPFAKFKTDLILNRVAAGAYTVFMAVPTIYVKLIQAIESETSDSQSAIIAGFAAMRLMVSGSAALPASVHEHWTRLTNQQLLERYGMTEIGMALSNPYHGERRPGAVGQPLPLVELRLKSETGEIIAGENQPGEIQVCGPCVFLEYWDRESVTIDSFDEGWFQTGDVAVLEDGYYRIMGRQSVDIIKSGGYKLSALEIEAALLQHEAIRECAVVGVEDATWGEAVAVAIVVQDDTMLQLESLRNWCQGRLSQYKIPKHLLVVDQLPRNAMGKITKPAVRKFF